MFQDTLQAGLVFVPGSVTVNSNPLPTANPVTGVSLGTVAVGDNDLIGFDVTVVSMPPPVKTYINQGNVTFAYAASVDPIYTSNDSNLVLISVSNGPECQ